MKTLALVGSLLLLWLVLRPAGHSAHHWHCYPVSGGTARLVPVRVLRSATAAQQHRLVRAVR